MANFILPTAQVGVITSSIPATGAITAQMGVSHNADSSTADVNISLPPVLNKDGHILGVFHDVGGNACNITAQAGEVVKGVFNGVVVNGQGPFNLSEEGEYVTFRCDEPNNRWLIY